MSPEQWAEVEQMLHEGFSDGELTLDEAKAGMAQFEAKHGEVSADAKAALLALFHLLDADGNGSVTVAELEAAEAKYA